MHVQLVMVMYITKISTSTCYIYIIMLYSEWQLRVNVLLYNDKINSFVGPVSQNYWCHKLQSLCRKDFVIHWKVSSCMCFDNEDLTSKTIIITHCIVHQKFASTKNINKMWLKTTSNKTLKYNIEHTYLIIVSIVRVVPKSCEIYKMFSRSIHFWIGLILGPQAQSQSQRKRKRTCIM